MTKPHCFEFKVYHDDIDCMGVMYNANYLKHMEHARSDYLQSLGQDQRKLMQEGILFVVFKANLTYRAPAHFDECLQIETIVSKITPARMIMNQRMLRDNDVLCLGEFQIACVDNDFKARAIPDFFMESRTNG